MTGGSLDGQRVAVWGLTFKARTDDLRQSPALSVIERLRAQGAKVRAFDPAISRGLDGIEVCADPYAACEGARALVVLTEWDEFRRLDFTKVLSLLAAPNVVDARNLLDPAALRRLGFNYTGVGR
jgi:UDPglucose 6-dehydrogenase